MLFVITAYENRIRELEGDKIELGEQIANCGRPLRSFDETLRTVPKLAFTDRLAYTRNEGYRTVYIAFRFKLLANLNGNENKMARPERFELPTTRFEAEYSIQLSYGRVFGDFVIDCS